MRVFEWDSAILPSEQYHSLLFHFCYYQARDERLASWGVTRLQLAQGSGRTLSTASGSHDVFFPQRVMCNFRSRRHSTMTPSGRGLSVASSAAKSGHELARWVSVTLPVSFDVLF